MTGALVFLVLQAGTSVTLEGTAARLQTVLDRISAQTGESLYSDKVFDDVVLYVQCASLPPREVQTMVAEAVDGKWVDGPQGRTLMRDQVVFNEREANYCKEFADKARAYLRSLVGESFDEASAKALRERLLAPPDNSEPVRLRNPKDQFATPLMRLLLDLLLAADLEEMAKLDGGRLLFRSTTPTKVFHKLAVTTERLAQYDKEQSIWNALSTPNEVISNYRNYGLTAPSESDMPAGNVSLAFGRQNHFPIFVAAVVVLDRDGKLKDCIDTNFMLPELEARLSEESLGALTGEPIKPSERTKQYDATSTFSAAALEPIPEDHFAYKSFIDPFTTNRLICGLPTR
jgi:hypothetical protein